MKVNKLNDMFRGWVVGNFDPSLWKTDDVEVAVKTYKKVIMNKSIITKWQLRLPLFQKVEF